MQVSICFCKFSFHFLWPQLNTNTFKYLVGVSVSNCQFQVNFNYHYYYLTQSKYIYYLIIYDIWLGEEVASFKCIVKLCLISGHNFKLQYLIYLFVVWHFCICLIANSFCNFADTILYRRKFSTIYLSLSYTVGIHCFCAQHLWVLNPTWHEIFFGRLDMRGGLEEPPPLENTFQVLLWVQIT